MHVLGVQLAMEASVAAEHQLCISRILAASHELQSVTRLSGVHPQRNLGCLWVVFATAVVHALHTPQGHGSCRPPAPSRQSGRVQGEWGHPGGQWGACHGEPVRPGVGTVRLEPLAQHVLQVPGPARMLCIHTCAAALATVCSHPGRKACCQCP
jgi:hypothetical protein